MAKSKRKPMKETKSDRSPLFGGDVIRPLDRSGLRELGLMPSLPKSIPLLEEGFGKKKR